MVTTPLPGFVRAVREFQQLGLVNKAVIDATAVDIPLVVLAKNETERKERFLRQALVLLIAFIIAPLHAKVIAKLFSQRLGFAAKGLNEKLMQLPYKDLVNVAQLKRGVETLFKQTLKEPLPAVLKTGINKALRENLIKAKTRFLMSDLALCGFLLSSVGFIKVFFGKYLSGKDQFSGELGIVSEKALDKIYQKDAEKRTFRFSKNLKGIITLGLGIGVPILTGFALFKLLMKGNIKGASGFFINKIAPRLDYNYPQYVKFLKGWPLLSDGSQIMLSLLLTAGELSSARSRREFKELAIQRNSIDALFFFGTPVFMKVLSGSTSVQGAINKVIAKGPAIVQKVAMRSALAYIASFILASLSVAGIVTITNNVTRKAVKDEARKLDKRLISPAAFSIFHPDKPSKSLQASPFYPSLGPMRSPMSLAVTRNYENSYTPDNRMTPVGTTSVYQ